MTGMSTWMLQSLLLTAWHESVCNTPFFLGQHPLTPASVDVDTKVPTAKAFTEDLQAAVDLAKVSLRSAQTPQAEYANQKQREVNYEVGQALLLSTLKLRPMGSMRFHGCTRLLEGKQLYRSMQVSQVGICADPPSCISMQVCSLHIHHPMDPQLHGSANV